MRIVSEINNQRRQKFFFYAYIVVIIIINFVWKQMSFETYN